MDRRPKLGFVQNLSLVTRGLQRVFDARLKYMGLTTARGRVLLYLLDRGRGATQSEVTEYLQVENPTAVRILDGLEELGYVERCPAPRDRRAKIVVLTEAGQPVAETVAIMTSELLSELTDGIEAAELAAATSLLDRMTRNLNAMGSERRTAAPQQELSL